MEALAAFGPTGLLRFWVYIRCCGCCRWRFRSYSESPFSDAKKVTEKALPRRTARSLKLGVPSLRDRSGRSGYGLLRCTSLRCVRLRRTVAAHPVTKPAEGAKDQKPEQKQRQKPKPDQKIAAFGGSYSWIRCGHREIGRLSGRLREQARSHKEQKARQRSCQRRSRPTQQ